MPVHLHTHSPFSLLDGASAIQSLIDQALHWEMGALAITDHSSLAGAIRFQRLAEKAGIKPIHGAEVILEDGGHLVLLAQNRQGYKNLSHLLTHAHLHPKNEDRTQPRLSWSDLEDHHQGLIALSGCRRGEIPSLLLARHFQNALGAANRYKELFGGNFYLELQANGLPRTRWLNQTMAQLGEVLGIPLVAGQNVHYAQREGFFLHDVLTCIRTGTTLEEVHPQRALNGENWLWGPEEWRQALAPFPEALANTDRIAQACETSLFLGQDLLPRFQEDGQAGNRLNQLVWAGAKERYGEITPPIRQRLQHELNIIIQLGYAEYFLIVWDLVRFAHHQGIAVAGRGSAADSAVAYCLGITQVDSIGRGLLFERFLSLERAQRPDIDLDFDSRYRDQAQEYLQKTYGTDRVASVCTLQTFQARSALREIGKVLGIPEELLGRWAKTMPHIPADGIRRALDHYPELKADSQNLKSLQLLLDLCEAAAGLPRHLGTHLGGVILCRDPLIDHAPLQRAAKGVLIAQLDKEDVEDLGLIKLDLLSLRTLSAMQETRETVPLIAPPDDPQTYAMLQRGESIGVFQLESPAQRSLQARLETSCFEDIVASVALIRPGPIKGNMVQPFIERRRGEEEVSYLHPDLKPILEKTYGLVLYQEQVIAIATTIAGFTPGEADHLRRTMTHCRSRQEMEAIGELFVQKALKRGLDLDVAQTIFSYIQGYAGYGFCEAHAAAFAQTAYQTAYLAAHHPAPYFAALLNHQPLGYYSPQTLLWEARRRGVDVVPLEINSSRGWHYAHQGRIRIGLGQVRGMSEAQIDQILTARQEKLFTSYLDFILRTRIDQDVARSLVQAGAFDQLHPHRRGLLYQAQLPLPTNLGGLELEYTLPPPPEGLLPFTPFEAWSQEMYALGLTARDHLLHFYRRQLREMGVLTTAQARALPSGEKARVAGVVIRPHRPPTRTGRTVVFLSLEDETGILDVVAFEETYQRFGEVLLGSPLLLISGTIQEQGNARSLLTSRVSRLAPSLLDSTPYSPSPLEEMDGGEGKPELHTGVCSHSDSTEDPL